jgi:hypothetical protein
MIPVAVGNLIQASYGFENLSRFIAQPVKPEDGGSAGGARARSEEAKAKDDPVKQLTPAQQREIEQLKQTDREVRQHEQAHLSVGGELVTSGPSFTYATGPDRQRYAVGGEVSIDTSPGRNPQETIPKAQHIRATALAPAQPSAQDHSVAAQASRMESEARIELAQQHREEASVKAQEGQRLYREVAQSGDSQSASQLGGRLDFFA